MPLGRSSQPPPTSRPDRDGSDRVGDPRQTERLAAGERQAGAGRAGRRWGAYWYGGGRPAVRGGGRSRIPSGRWTLLGVLVAIAIIGHLAFWYAPRERTARLRPDSPGAALYGDASFDDRLWLPYPHQNAAQVERWLGDADAWTAALRRRLEGADGDQGSLLAPPQLPGFGPFRLPPSSELVVAWTEAAGNGDPRFAAAARVYPGQWAIGRLAGLLAGNPWLAGGDVEVGGVSARVRWQGRWWHLESRGSVPAAGSRRSRSSRDDEPALARLVSSRDLGPIASGEYLLRREGDELLLDSVASSGSAGLGPRRDALDRDTVLLLREGEGADRRALILLDVAVTSEGRLRLPSAAALTRGGIERFELPGESWVRIFGLDLEAGHWRGWDLASIDRRGLEAAFRTADTIDADTGPWHLVARPEAFLVWVRTLRRGLEAIPLVPRRDLRTWRDWEILLEPFGDYAEVELAVESSGRVRLRLADAPPAGTR